MVTEKCDVYSFGVVTLEVILGKHPGELISTVLSSSSSIENNRLLKDVLDQRLPPPTCEVATEVVFIVKLALGCLHVSPQFRPTMQYVSQKLVYNNPSFKEPYHTVTLGQLLQN